MRRMTVHKTQSERPDAHTEEFDQVTDLSAESDLAPVTNLRPTVGDDLRRRREAKGQTIEEVSEAIRIQKRYLQALEDGRIGDLPGTVYALGFLRTYAEHFGLSGDEFVTRFKEETEGKRPQQDYTLPEPIEDARVPTAAMFILAILLAVGAYVAWYNFWPDDLDFTASVPDVPVELAEGSDDTSAAGAPATDVPASIVSETPVAQEPAAPPAVADQPPAIEEPPAVETGDISSIEIPPPPPPLEAPAAEAPPVTGQADVPPASPAEDPAPAEPVASAPIEDPAQAPADVAVQAPAAVVVEAPPQISEPDLPPSPQLAEPAHDPQVYGTGSASSRITITAVEDAWLEVTNAEGDRLFSRTLRAGDSYRVPDREDLVFVTGNAGGLDITVDGVSTPPLGDTGIVRKNVKLEPQLLKQGRAWP